MIRQQLQPAFVIHTRAYRDTSMIVELFTPEHGRVSLLARGVKTGKAKKSLMLQPFRSLHVSWAGRGELPVMSAVEEAGRSVHLQGQALACGYYVNELIYHLLPRDDPAPELFARYWSVITTLDDLSLRDASLRNFELELLTHIGYEPVLDHDYQTGEMIAADTDYRYRVPEGPTLPNDEPDAVGTPLTIRGKTLHDLAVGNLEDPVSLKQARDLMRALIHYQLDGRELLSRALFNSYRKLESKSPG